MSTISFRDATLVDATGISRAHVRSWQETYQGIVPDAHLQSLDPESRAKMWAERFNDPTYDGHVIVAEDSDKNIVGFIGLGPSRSTEYPSWGEVRAIYLINKFKGLGVGRQLFALGKQRLQALGYGNFFCWVLKDNPTRHFYELAGGLLSAYEKTIQIGGANLFEVAYEWKIQVMAKLSGSAYSRCYANPLILKRGEAVTITKAEDKDNPQWAGWIGCESKDRIFGWVHQDFLQINDTEAVAIREYTAWELNAQPNESFRILDDKSGWYWCESQSGERGWLPYETFEIYGIDR